MHLIDTMKTGHTNGKKKCKEKASHREGGGYFGPSNSTSFLKGWKINISRTAAPFWAFSHTIESNRRLEAQG